MINAEERIETSELSNAPIEVWFETMYDRGDSAAIDAEMRERLHDEIANDDYDVFGEDECVVVDTPSFTGVHNAPFDRHDEKHVSEEGTYIHDETDWELEVLTPASLDELQGCLGGEHHGAAALTPSERNPQL